ncbi:MULTISPECIES: hypothetical protein [unclassified Bradyrhizobium]|uniref:hypothetical protein n=1 Tax=unclassified Bradyrhizobium TaxID=2631580 RepID=UPI003391768F
MFGDVQFLPKGKTQPHYVMFKVAARTLSSRRFSNSLARELDASNTRHATAGHLRPKSDHVALLEIAKLRILHSIERSGL